MLPSRRRICVVPRGELSQHGDGRIGHEFAKGVLTDKTDFLNVITGEEVSQRPGGLNIQILLRRDENEPATGSKAEQRLFRRRAGRDRIGRARWRNERGIVPSRPLTTP